MNNLKNGLKVIALLLLLGFSKSSIAQDRILYRGKPDTLRVKIYEIGVDEIRYKFWPVDSTMPMMVENKSRISRVIMSDGMVYKFTEDEFTNKENYAMQRTMDVKVDFLSPIRGVYNVAYEYSISPGLSVEGGLGIISLNPSEYSIYNFDKARGILLRGGVKFINQPDYKIKGMRYAHVLKGAYLSPQVTFLHQVNRIESDYYYSGNAYEVSTVINGVGLFINFGKQWVFSDIFCVDFFIGPGIGTKNIRYESMYNGQKHISRNKQSDMSDTGGMGFMAMTMQDNGASFCIQSGLRLGMLIGKKKGYTERKN